MMRILRYSPDQAARWDEFVSNSANGTFLHLRPYMDYHADRFADCSLMAFDDADRLMAILPANADGHTLHSHQGLTYGGWITARRHFPPSATLQLWEGFVNWLADNGFAELIYKPIPAIYHRYPAEADLYALFRLGAEPAACGLSATIALRQPLLLNDAARQRINRARRDGVVITRAHDFAPFMQMLAERLLDRYDKRPVHSLDEITLLASRFPENIKLIEAREPNGTLLAGTIIYITDRTVHTQYMTTTDEGRRRGILAAVIAYVIESECQSADYLDFGISTEQSGHVLNEGLADQKYGLGGRPTIYQTFRLKIDK